MEEALRLERLSLNDQLTCVMNRHALEEMLKNQFNDKSAAVIAVDVNGLKEVNDSGGHHAGDRLITTVAECLVHVFGIQHVFRTGGDEFIVFLQDHTEDECRESILRYLLQCASMARYANSAVPSPPRLSMFAVKSPPPAYIMPSPRRVSSEQV